MGCLERSNFNEDFWFFYITIFLAGVFAIPDYLHKNVVSLLCHMLQTDPMKRATIEDIRNHEWFQVDLAAYLFPDRDAAMATLDHEAVQEASEVNFKILWALS